MPLLARRGYTLIELLIALVLLGMVSGAIYKVLVNNQRLYLAQTQQIDLQQNMRAAAAILPAEFRELDAADGDIRAMSATSIRIRAMRLLGWACLTPPLGSSIGKATPPHGPTTSGCQPRSRRSRPVSCAPIAAPQAQGRCRTKALP